MRRHRASVGSCLSRHGTLRDATCRGGRRAGVSLGLACCHWSGPDCGKSDQPSREGTRRHPPCQARTFEVDRPLTAGEPSRRSASPRHNRMYRVRSRKRAAIEARAVADRCTPEAGRVALTPAADPNRCNGHSVAFETLRPLILMTSALDPKWPGRLASATCVDSGGNTSKRRSRIVQSVEARRSDLGRRATTAMAGSGQRHRTGAGAVPGGQWPVVAALPAAALHRTDRRRRAAQVSSRA